jgi:predicted phage terminase large subunit-like protein
LGWFTHLYLSHYIQYQTPDFHWQIYKDLSNDEVGFIEILGFRGSAKSTIASLAMPLWAAVTGKKDFIILISDSFPQAKIHIANIIHELNSNELLNKDFGPFQGKDEWQATSIILKKKTRILARSRGQKIRGLRHLQHRPDLVICDDIENIEAVRTIDQRNKTEEWFLSDVVPAVNSDSGKLIVIGSLLHTDSLIARLRKQIINDKTGIIREYPLIKNEKSIWETRFDSKEIEKVKHRVGQRFFLREYLLKLVPEEGQIIKSVQYYSELPKITKIGIGVDLAISQKQTADNSAINVIAQTDGGKFYNIQSMAGRWNFNDTLEKINAVYTGLKKANPSVPILLGIEATSYQKAAAEEMRRRYKLPVKEITTTTDKRSRLEAVQPYFESGQIYFRQNADADVVNEILNFGIEQFDDRCDAFLHSLSLLLTEVRPDIFWI